MANEQPKFKVGDVVLLTRDRFFRRGTGKLSERFLIKAEDKIPFVIAEAYPINRLNGQGEVYDTHKVDRHEGYENNDSTETETFYRLVGYPGTARESFFRLRTPTEAEADQLFPPDNSRKIP